MSEVLYRVYVINKDNSEKFFWTDGDFSKDVKEAWRGEKSEADAAAVKAKELAGNRWGCPCPYDVMVEDTEGKNWYIPGSVMMDA